MTKGNNTLLFYYDSDGNVTSFKYGGTMYYYIKNLQGDIVKIINQAGTVYASYVYDAWGNIKSVSGDSTLRELNPFCYRGYVYDSESGLYYLQSRYYDPFTGRFINADVYCDTQSGSPLSTNMFAYCENNSIFSFDPYGTRTYFLNGINNDGLNGIPKYANDFKKKLSSVKDFRLIALYKGKAGFKGTVKGVAKVFLEMLNFDVYTSYVIKIIKDDLKKKPLSKGEQLNLIGYSGGGQIAINVMVKMANKFTNVVLIGAPVVRSWKSKTKVSVLYAGWDPLSWTVGWGFKSYFTGWYGHTGYFTSKNINNVAKIVKRIIK